MTIIELDNGETLVFKTHDPNPNDPVYCYTPKELTDEEKQAFAWCFEAFFQKSDGSSKTEPS